MKRRIFVIAILILSLTPAFAATDEADDEIYIDAYVDSSEYSLNLYYDTEDLTEESEVTINNTEWTIDDPDVLTETEVFSLIADGGNTELPQVVNIEISPSPFIGELDNGETYQTDIVPSIANTNDDRGDISADGLSISWTIPPGYQSDPITVARFVFQWLGDDNLPSGRYESDITVTYELQ